MIEKGFRTTLEALIRLQFKGNPERYITPQRIYDIGFVNSKILGDSMPKTVRNVARHLEQAQFLGYVDRVDVDLTYNCAYRVKVGALGDLKNLIDETGAGR